MSKSEENRLGSQLSGEVRLTLENYHNLLEMAVTAEKRAEKFDMAVFNIKKFLTFLRKEEWFDEVVTRFNKEVSGVRITLDDRGQISMEITDE